MDGYIISELGALQREMTEISAVNNGLAGEIRNMWRGKDADEFTGRLLSVGETAAGAASQLNMLKEAARAELLQQPATL